MNRQLHPRWRLIGGCLLLVGLATCSHELRIRNLDQYAAPIRLTSFESPPRVAILPYRGSPDGLFYFNVLVERINQSPLVKEVRTDHVVGSPRVGGFQPDLIMSINPVVEYRSSGWNFLINWPGFLIFTPAWNGYVYHADIMTQVVIHDRDGRALSQTDLPLSYSIRQAEMDRTIWTGLTWFEVSALAFFGGIYNASTFDRDIIRSLEAQVKDNYGTYVANQLQPKVQAAADSIRSLPPVSSAGSPGSPPIAPVSTPSGEAP